MSQAFYRKWRPKIWEEIIGQDHVVNTLRNAVVADRVAHAYLFAGPRGTGKTSTARLLAKAVNCLSNSLEERPCNTCNHCQAVNEGRFLDLIEIDAASNTSVDDVRDLRDKINFSPNQARYKVYIIDEVHMLSTAAFNALLKTLEEPPSHAIFILATTEVHKIPATVISRCQQHEFRRIPVSDITESLQKIAKSEDIEVEEAALTLIARQATGSLRDAVSLLDQLASSSQQISLDLAQLVLGTATNQAVLEVVNTILEADSTQGLDRIHRTLDGGSDPRQFARQIVDYLRNLLLVKMGSANLVDITGDTKAQMAQHAKLFSIEHLLQVIRLFNQAANDARVSWQPSLPLELALIESLEGPEEKKDRFIKPKINLESDKASEIPQSQGRTDVAASTGKEQTSPTPKEQVEVVPSKVQQNWRQILTRVRQKNPQTQALLNSCKPLGLKNGVLILGFNGEFARSKMEQGNNIEILKQVMISVIGESMPIRCILSSGGELPADIDQDGMVATALRDLGGEIVDIQ